MDTKDLEILGMTTGEALVLLTQSPKITWTDKAREALYHLAQELYEEDVDIHNVEESQKDRVKMYITQWGWVHYGYCGPEYTIQNVLDELEIIFEKKESPVDQIEYAKKELHKKMEKQEALFKKLDMNADERYIITAAQDFGYTKSYRASLMSLANLTINTLLKEYTKKEGYSFGQMGVCTAEEVCSYLRGEKPLPDVDTLNKRMQFSVFFSGLGIDKVIVGSEAKKWVADNVEQEEVDRDMTEIPGTVACSGDEDVVRGVAKIVLRSDDLAKVTQGDVIISTTTIPEYVPAMRRASAIATETGGLTCHAAIVSREMNKPCLIGIKHVTQIFKDGDHVEVDLKNSLIKKI
ncbi:hypothetical protein C0581_00860 [Candidatus Parcubacteria bacterium]|nr:MAG: hypothetical protein C0581_00860 [Candidatus Parcubacteria bacterium]